MTAFHPTTNGIPPIRQPATENFAVGFFIGEHAVDAPRTAQDVGGVSRSFVQGVADGAGRAAVTAVPAPASSQRRVTTASTP
jgi:hypothetical protein